MLNKRNTLLLLWGIIMLGVFLRLVLLFTIEREVVDGDEACFGLMAKHIITKSEFPIFIWKAHYGGALISYIAAIIFLFFGISNISLKIGTLFFAILSIWFTYLLAKKMVNEKIGLLAAFLVAIPSGLVTFFSISVYGVHSEILMFGPLILFLLYKTIYEQKTYLYKLLGFVSGVSFWLSPTTLPFLLVVVTIFLLKDKKILFSYKFHIFLCFFLIGALPFIIYNIKNPFASFFRLGGRVLELDRRMLNTYANPALCFFERIIFRIKSIPQSLSNLPKFLLHLLGLERRSLFFLRIIGALIYVSCGFYFLYILLKKFLKGQRVKPYISIFLAFGIWVILLFCLAGLNHARQLIFIYPVISIALAVFVFKLKAHAKILSIFCIGVIFLNNLGTNIALFQLERFYFKPLISFLKLKNLPYGYATYNIAYPVIFESNEQIIISPVVNPGSDDRYPLYTQQVNNALNKCYIFDNGSLSSKMFEEKIGDLGIKYQKERISNFLVYYDFSQEVLPKDLNLPAWAFDLNL